MISPRPRIYEVGNPVLWVDTRKIINSHKGTRVFWVVSEGRLVLHLSISIARCDVTQVYSFKAIGIHSYARYVGGILCASGIV